MTDRELNDQFFKAYQKIYAKNDQLKRSKWDRILTSFLEITHDIYIFGDCEKPDGTLWKSRDEAFEFWRQKENLSQTHAIAFFDAIDSVAAYT
jgi:hypothetical protein